MNWMAVCFYGSLAASAGVLLLPLIVIIVGCIVNQVSLSAVMREPESRGFTVLYYLVAFVLHLPMAVVFAIFAYAIRRGSLRAARIWYVLLLLAMSFSALSYIKCPIGYYYARYIPAVLYVSVLLPLLTLALLLCAKAQRSRFTKADGPPK